MTSVAGTKRGVNRMKRKNSFGCRCLGEGLDLDLFVVRGG